MELLWSAAEQFSLANSVYMKKKMSKRETCQLKQEPKTGGLIFSKKILFIFTCLGDLPACMSVRVVGNEPSSSGRAASALSV